MEGLDLEAGRDESGSRRLWLMAGLAVLTVIAAGIGIWVAAIALALADLSGSALDGCGPERADPRYCLTASLQGHQLIVVGHTTLPDGAMIEVMLANSSRAVDNDRTMATTHSGEFSARFDVSSWAPGELMVSALLRVRDQPADIQTRYGPDGARFFGPAVHHDHDYDPPPQNLEAWVYVQLRP